MFLNVFFVWGLCWNEEHERDIWVRLSERDIWVRLSADRRKKRQNSSEQSRAEQEQAVDNDYYLPGHLLSPFRFFFFPFGSFGIWSLLMRREVLCCG
jgi:hypothetical protein